MPRYFSIRAPDHNGRTARQIAQAVNEARALDADVWVVDTSIGEDGVEWMRLETLVYRALALYVAGTPFLTPAELKAATDAARGPS